MDTMVRTEKARLPPFGHFCHHFLPRLFLGGQELFVCSMLPPSMDKPEVEKGKGGKGEKGAKSQGKGSKGKHKDGKGAFCCNVASSPSKKWKMSISLLILVLEGTCFQLFFTSLIGGGAGIFCLLAWFFAGITIGTLHLDKIRFKVAKASHGFFWKVGRSNLFRYKCSFHLGTSSGVQTCQEL